jgi:hypothetical protein
MRKMFVLASILAVSVVGVLAQADRPDPRADEYRSWMQSVQPGVRSLATNINEKMLDKAASDADALEATFKKVEAFWGQRGLQDAVVFSQTARKALRAASKDAKAGNAEAAQADLKELRSTCADCHMAHREGTPGSFTIK